ncbi:hypothetical protein BHF71_10130 [Vulcanibacillus modesticaldus]|uniref:Methyltransferase n=1 Tax=Vulcanibacillus modesticaldus TaxID=337097 RepID=A0A1D2YTU9_9BACI|nr:DNA methyltransferase [Vulcanibacillus modesticaldus]OEF99124.1 hypothetical protein BHF71_10130 [Vulcanibacillus modesticaldus]
MSIKDGGEWLKLSISIWDDSKTKEEKKFKHPASFPISIASKLIRIYTEPGDTILDPFVGIGSTILAAAQLNRKSIGFEINKDYINIIKKRLINFDNDLYMIFNQSSLDIDKFLHEEQIDFCITSPPYWNILNRKRTADNKSIINYGNNKDDLSNITDYELFLSKIHIIFKKIHKLMKPNKHCVIIIQDIRKKSNFYPYHIDITKMMVNIGYSLEDYIIWDRKKEYNNLKPLGYPYVFRVNKVHEYISIFKKV